LSIRREPTYLSTDTWQCLWIIAQSKDISPDQLADDLLSRLLIEKYPSVIKYQNEVQKLRRDIIKSIAGQPE